MEPTNKITLSAGERSLIKEFNNSGTAKEALSVVVNSGLPIDRVAAMLYKAGGRVDAEVLGLAIGHHHPLWQQLANEFPMHFTELHGISIVKAIRSYLWRFRLPGESAQIERILQGFARAYFHHNPPSSSPHCSDCKVDPEAVGHYTRAVLTGAQVCCTHCGSLDDVRLCQGCQTISFCRRCCRLASKRGHAVCAVIGVGRGCLAAKAAAGKPVFAGDEVAFADGTSGDRSLVVPQNMTQWQKCSPFRSEDSVMVLSYSVIMLTTNLHSPKVKQKMTVQQFLVQCNTINDGANFPGDFLADIYDEIKAEELKVMSSG